MDTTAQLNAIQEQLADLAAAVEVLQENSDVHADRLEEVARAVNELVDILSPDDDETDQGAEADDDDDAAADGAEEDVHILNVHILKIVISRGDSASEDDDDDAEAEAPTAIDRKENSIS